MSKCKNSNLHAAKRNKNDEFYTRLEDIEAEILMNPDYIKQFYGKTVFCNCDNPEWSNFNIFFTLHFDQLNLKKVIFTHYKRDGSPSYKEEWYGDKDENYNPINVIRTELKGNGDFRSPECIEALDECDIVVTNPPFSLFREFVNLIVSHGKDFVVIGNMNAAAYKEIFPLIKDGKIKTGYHFNKNMVFEVPEGYRWDEKATAKMNNGKKYGVVPAITWFTTLDLNKHHEKLVLVEHYNWNPDKYPKYDNYDAINVDKIKDIPCDYYGVMGVPITFLDKFCPEQFEIVAFRKGDDGADLFYTRESERIQPYTRILVRRRNRSEEKKDDKR